MLRQSASLFALMLLSGLFYQGCNTSPGPGEDDSASGGQGGQAGKDEDQQGGAGDGQGDGGAGGDVEEPATAGEGGGSQEPGGAGGQTPQGGAGGQSPVAGGTGGTPPGANATASTCPGQHPYCNDFEKFTVGQGIPYPFISASKNVQVVDDKAFSGKVSIRIAGGSGTFRLGVRELFTNPKKIGYTRMMVWMENPPGNGGHWSIIELGGASSMFAGVVSFGGWGDTQRRMLYYASQIPGAALADCSYKQSGLMIPMQKWACVEMGMDETQTNPYSVKIDGTSVMSFRSDVLLPGCIGGTSNKGIWYLMDTLSASWGFTHYHAQERPTRVWIDDIVVSEKPIGCPAK